MYNKNSINKNIYGETTKNFLNFCMHFLVYLFSFFNLIKPKQNRSSTTTRNFEQTIEKEVRILEEAPCFCL